MEFKPFSPKQMTALTWWCTASPHRYRDAIICDGAVRSGKTLCLSLSFVAWAFYRFDGMAFALCGKTITSLKRNMVLPLLDALREMGFSCRMKASQNVVDISLDGRHNRFYLFGGRDESSASLIQGMTLAGVLFDEVALMPRSFVEQALARCSVSQSKFWFNCNPDHPLHWFHTEWIAKIQEKNGLYLHFTMQDNPSLTPDIVARYRSLYSGAFYDRFVEGRWVAAQGLVYPQFDRSVHVCKPPDSCEDWYISCDYGTVNPASFGLWGLKDGVWYRIREYYYSSRREGCQKTDEEYYMALDALAGNLPIAAVVCDPSAASFITCIRRHGKFRVIPARNDVADGIRKVADALHTGTIRICEGCLDTMREFSLYRWDESGLRDQPRKEDDHAMDDLRYFVSTVVDAPSDGVFAVAACRQVL